MHTIINNNSRAEFEMNVHAKSTEECNVTAILSEEKFIHNIDTMNFIYIHFLAVYIKSGNSMFGIQTCNYIYTSN